MAKTSHIHVRTEPALKAEVEEILNSLGLTHADAINIFYNQIKLNQGLPFPVKIPTCNLSHEPNKVTKKAINDLKNNKDVTSFNNTEELFNDLGI